MWPDRAAARVMAAIRDQFRVTTLVETGTAHGIGARFWATLFPDILSCDSDGKMLDMAQLRLKDIPGVRLYLDSSPAFLVRFWNAYKTARRMDFVVFLLDAHWYADWPLLGELRALKGFPRAIIIIHDFKVPGLGYVSYNGQDLDWDYIKADLLAVNPGFHIYQNTREGCDIVTPAEVAEGKVPGLVWDKCTRHVLEDIVWESERRAYRGILYAVPGPLPEGLGLKEVEVGPGPQG